MIRFILTRLLGIIVTLFLLASITFFMMHTVPGGPFTKNSKLPPEVEAALNAKYHLDKPIIAQYLNYLERLCRFDLGPSLKYDGLTVNELIKMGFPASAIVGSMAILLTLVIGIPTGIYAALKQNKFQDRLGMILSTIGVVTPSFVLATILIYIFGLKLSLLPIYGVDGLKGYILPALALSGFSISYIARLTRSSMIEVLTQDYMVTARGKGLKPFRIIFKHGFRNAMIPIITVLGPTFAALVTGTFVIEKIFALPGMGKHFVQSIGNRDYSVIMGVTLFYALFLMLMVFVVDLLYLLIDPRIKLRKR